jgi:hypothetical protein
VAAKTTEAPAANPASSAQSWYGEMYAIALASLSRSCAGGSADAGGGAVPLTPPTHDARANTSAQVGESKAAATSKVSSSSLSSAAAASSRSSRPAAEWSQPHKRRSFPLPNDSEQPSFLD